MELEQAVPPAPRKKLGWLGAIAVLSCLFVAFFWPALVRYSEVYYSPAAISQTQSLTRVEAGHVPGNELLSDLAVQMEPWLLYNKDELAAGRIPLWNPYNGGGVPHLANGQAAVFSPFSLPYYLLSFRAALIVSAALKLLSLGLFTFLFLRQLGLFVLPALLGAIAFAFGGHNVLLLGYPHPAAAAALPAGLYFVERTFQCLESTGRHSPSSLVGLCLSMAVGLIAGQPEPAFFALYLIGLYSLARAARTWWKRGGKPRMALALVPRLVELAVVAILAACLGAFKIVPFLEYLRDSRLLEQRSSAQTPLIGDIWPLHFFPNLAGNPSLDYYLRPTIPPPNYETANLVYAGGLVLFLALISLAFVRRNAAHCFFALVAVLWIFYAYDVGGAWRVFSWIPGLALAPVNRSQAVWLFAMACCAAFALQRMLETERRKIVWAVLALAVGGALLFTVRQGADALLERVIAYCGKLADPPKIVAADIRLFAEEHVAEMSLLFGLGCTFAAGIWLAPRGPIRQTLAAGIVVLVYLGSGNLLKQYNPVCENRFFYPVTPAIAALQETVGDKDRLVILGEDTIVPDTNMPYRLSLISSYDGLWMRRYDRLFRHIFGESNNWRHTLHGTGQGLKLFGVDWVLAPDEWIPIDTQFAAARPVKKRDLHSAGEIVRGVQFHQNFTVTRRNLQGIRLLATRSAEAAEAPLMWFIEDAKTDELLLNGDVDAWKLKLSPTVPRSLILRFDEPIDLTGRQLRLRLRAPGAGPGQGLSLWSRSDGPPLVNEALWRATNDRLGHPDAPMDWDKAHPDLRTWFGVRGDEVIEGGLWIDLSYGLLDFEYEKTIIPFDLFRYERALGRWHVVGKSMSASTEEDAWIRTLHPSTDPANIVVLEGAGEGTKQFANEATRIDVEQDLPQAKRLRFTRTEPGWLVLTQPWHAGWKARVNGAEREILRANYAFGAVEVGAGESVVELEFAPESFVLGVSVTLASALIATASFFFLRSRNRATQPAGSVSCAS
ncbi:MAG TPA: YfhO family protein [Planctomycetota bacterium]|nr:YfhO family protein [Planctomycetota bacterium]